MLATRYVMFMFFCLTLFGHTNFLFISQVAKKVDNSGGGVGIMSEGKEHIVAEHPKAWWCGWWKGAA
jgi:hypothetical protein